MKESVPSDDEIAKLEKAVNSARANLRGIQALLSKKYNADPTLPTPHHLMLTVSTVPPDADEEARLMVADNYRGELGEALEALEVARERLRVDEVVRAREEEISFGKDVDDCPICLDPLYAGRADASFTGNLTCCGKEICRPCAGTVCEREGGLKECPLCRHPFPVPMASQQEMKEKLAKTKPRYQYFLGKEYFHGDKEGGKNRRNDRKAMSYFQMAAEGGDAESQAFLGFLYGKGDHPHIAEKSAKESLYWFELAASNGHLLAHANVAFLLAKDSPQLGLRMMTFAAHHGVVEAQIRLSDAYSCFEDSGKGITNSLERARYWMKKVLHSTEAETLQRCGAYGKYAILLLGLQTQNMNGVVDVAGYSSVPEALYWFRKAKETDAITTKESGIMENCDFVGSYRCHCCKTSSEKYKLAGQGNMMKCRRCHWARYCSKACQLRHWEMGHKKDCKKKY